MMKVKGYKFTYYLKNGCEIIDESFKFSEPVEETDGDLIKAAEIIKNSVKDVVRSDEGGYIAYGNLYVNTREISAIRFELVREA